MLRRIQESVAVALAGVLVLSLVVATSSPVKAMECGDVNDSCSVTAVDALAVLQKAVGLAVDLECGTASCTTTTTLVRDECFDDQDCIIFGPGFEHCGGPNGHTCVNCDADDADCESGFQCVAFECVPDGE